MKTQSLNPKFKNKSLLFTQWIVIIVAVIAVALDNELNPLAAQITKPAKPPVKKTLPAIKKTRIKYLGGTAFYRKLKAASLEILVDGRLSGSGWIATSDGYAFTASHVVGLPGRRIEVLSPSFGRLKAKVVAIDRGSDLALLKILSSKKDYPYLSNAAKTSPPLSRIYSFNAPLFRHHVLLDGMIARDSTTFEYYGDQKQYFEMFHVSGVVLKGSSGGSWVNRRGEVVGLQSGVIFINKVPTCMSHISSVASIRRLLETKKHQSTPTLRLAVEELWQQSYQVIRRFPMGTEGLIAKIVVKDGPAEKAGIKKWDLLVAADDKKIRLPDELLRMVRAKKPGDFIKLKVVNPDNSGTRLINVKLEALEAAWIKASKR